MLEGIEVLIMQPDRLVSGAGACNFGGDGAETSEGGVFAGWWCLCCGVIWT